MLGFEKRRVAASYEKKVSKMKVSCPGCKTVYTGPEAMDSLFICPECKKYMQISAKARIHMLVDKNTFEPWYRMPQSENPLNMDGYQEKLDSAKRKSGSSEAVTIGKAKIDGEELVIGVCDPSFMIGSMGHEMGERITAAFERAITEKLPVVLFCCSGGARMQESILSLMQMEKTVAAVKLHSEAGLFYCSVLTDPTMGGVTASFATLGDIVLAEKGARVGFAGPRVIQQTIGQELPEGFQTAEFLLEHGMIDGIVERKNMKKTLAYLLRVHNGDKKAIKKLKPAYNLPAFPASLGKKTPWEKVKICRSADRASAMDYIERIFSNFYELHGDRYFRDDQALIGGIGMLGSMPVTVLSDMRGKTVEECIQRNFGMPMPDGYRKAVRLMKQAEKFGRPVVTFINTSGAFCGVAAEERGQGEAIAKSIMEMSALKVPVLCILIGEGGSGGALATAVGNEVWILENAIYSILSPEGYSSILWKTDERAEEAASIMKLSAQDLYELKIVDRIIPEYGIANEETVDRIAIYIKQSMLSFFKRYCNMSGNEIAQDRYNRFRKF